MHVYGNDKLSAVLDKRRELMSSSVCVCICTWYMGALRKAKYLPFPTFLSFVSVQPRTRPVTASLAKVRGMRTCRPSLLLPRPRKSASWNCPPRCRRLIPALTLLMSRSWSSGPACCPCLRCRPAQRWGARTRTKGP